MSYILGVDEVGRGAWAGPLVVGAVVLGDCSLPELNDSKLLNKQKREILSDLIQAQALTVSLGWVEPWEIDKIGLTAATKLGIKRALRYIEKHKELEIIIDGHIDYLPRYKNARCLVKADGTVPAVSAASIVAKVARDEYMAKIGADFPSYGFDSHVGYGTKKHQKSIADYGLLRIHRRSFKPIAIKI